MDIIIDQKLKKFENHFYLNTGDWIESCSAIVELMDGSIQLIKIDDNNIVKVQNYEENFNSYRCLEASS